MYLRRLGLAQQAGMDTVVSLRLRVKEEFADLVSPEDYAECHTVVFVNARRPWADILESIEKEYAQFDIRYIVPIGTISPPQTMLPPFEE
jgi:hypothetical protein